MQVTPDEMWTRFLRVESMSETDPSPIVRAVRDNTKDIENLRVENEREHRTIRLQVYFFLAAVAGAIATVVAVRTGVVP